MQTRLRQIGDDVLIGDTPQEQPTTPPSPAPPTPRFDHVATTMLLTSLRALSQRTLIALGNLFVLAAAGSAFWLWFVTLPDPSAYQLVGLFLYGTLVLALTRLVLARR